MIEIIPPRQQYKSEYLAYWEDFLTSDDLNYLNYSHEWQGIKNAGIGTIPNQYDSSIRNSRVNWMYKNEDNSKIWSKFANAIAEVNSRFFHFDLTGCFEPAQLTLYSGSLEEHYNWHTDFDAANSEFTTPRKLSMSLLLTDPSEFQGGELQVKTTSDAVMTLEQKKGRAWFFPSFMLHRVSPVTFGVRKSLVLWVAGPPFK
jgi:PKHD-type hydroxylase